MQRVGNDGGQVGGAQHGQIPGVQHRQVALFPRPVNHRHEHHAIVLPRGVGVGHEERLHGVVVEHVPDPVPAVAAHVSLDDGHLAERGVVRLQHQAVHVAVAAGAVLLIHRRHVQEVHVGGTGRRQLHALHGVGVEVHFEALQLSVGGKVVAGDRVQEHRHPQVAHEAGVRVGGDVHHDAALTVVVSVDVVHGEHVLHGEVNHATGPELHHVQIGRGVAVPVQAVEGRGLVGHAHDVDVEGLGEKESVGLRHGEGVHVRDPVHGPGRHHLSLQRGLDPHQLQTIGHEGQHGHAGQEGQVVLGARLGQRMRRRQQVQEAGAFQVAPRALQRGYHARPRPQIAWEERVGLPVVAESHVVVTSGGAGEAVDVDVHVVQTVHQSLEALDEVERGLRPFEQQVGGDGVAGHGAVVEAAGQEARAEGS